MRKALPLFVPVLALCLASAARAAIEVPAPSPAASVTQTIGVTKITIDYHRPGVKGRKIWGELVPYDKVWRLGANEATTITFADPVTIKGRELAAGSYALFVVPKAGVFTLVFNSQAKQWGAFSYDESKDVLRFDIQPDSSKFAEWMTFEITPQPKGIARVDWRWERLHFSFDVEVPVEKIVWGRIDAGLASGTPTWEDYLSAARYAWQEKSRLPDAMKTSRKELLAYADRLGEERWLKLVFPHFLLGRFDGLDWYRFLAKHEGRHLAQMERILASLS
jgi:hypothetical protein